MTKYLFTFSLFRPDRYPSAFSYEVLVMGFNTEKEARNHAEWTVRKTFPGTLFIDGCSAKAIA